MSARYPLLSQALAAAGAFIVPVTFAFGHGATNAIDFGVIIGTTAAGPAALALAPRTHSQLVLATSPVWWARGRSWSRAGICSWASPRSRPRERLALSQKLGVAVIVLGVAALSAVEV
jgi:hypothetical protein